MPKPEKHVFICTQMRPPGHPRGSCAQYRTMEVFQKFMQVVQEQNLHEKVTVTGSGCLGPCAQGGCVLVYPDSTLYVGVTTNDVAEIVEQHFVNNEEVTRLKASKAAW